MTEAPADKTPPPLRRTDVPAYLKSRHGIDVTAQALAAFAVRGRGPKYRKCGAAVYYPIDELDAWATERLRMSPVVRSTAEFAALRAIA